MPSRRGRPPQCTETGERHDGKALFDIKHGYKGYYLSWQPARHDEALAVFNSLRIKPRRMECGPAIGGGKKWSCCLPCTSGRKLVAARTR